MAVNDPTMSVPTPTGILQGVAAFNWDGAVWQPAGRAGPSVATPTGVLQGVAAFSGTPPQPAGRSGPGVPTPTGVLDGVAVYTWSGSQWTPPGGAMSSPTSSGVLRGVAAFDWDGAQWQPAGQAGPDVATPYGVLQGVARFGWTGSAWAAVGAPSLSLDFMTPGTLDPRITFTRASIATYTDSTGTIQSAGVNTPRWDSSGGSLRGLLIEEARTNSLWPSLATGVGNWATFGSAALSVAGVAAPDGTTGTAALVAATSTANDIRAISNAVASGTAGTAYTLSVFVRKTAASNCFFQVAAGGVATAYFDLTNGTGVVGADLGAGITNKSVAVTPYPNGWYRVSFTLTPNATGAISWYVGMCSVVSATGDNRSAVGVVGQGIYAWGAQVEAGSFATSYIPTVSAAATRAQDLNTLSTAPWMTANLGSWFADFTLFGVSPGTCVIGTNVGGTSAELIVLSASNLLASWDGGAVLQTVNAATPGSVNKGVSAFTSPTGRICLNGGVVASGPQTGFNPAIVGFISAIPGPSANNGSGYIRRVQYWPRALSNAEMQAVTS